MNESVVNPQDVIDLQNTVNEAMKGAQPEQPVAEPVGQATETPVAEPEVVEQPQVEGTKQPEENNPQEELIEFVDEQPTEPTKFELAQFAQELGIEAQSPEDIKARWVELNDNLNKYKVQAEDKYANDKIRQLNDYVKQGGDIDTYLSRREQIRQIDTQIEAIKSLDPIEAVKFSLKQQGLSDDDVQAYIDSEQEIKLKVEGMRLINAEVQALSQGKVQFEQQEAAELEQMTKRREQYQAKVSEAIDKVTNVYGIKVNDKDRVALKQLSQDPHQILRKYFPVDETGQIKADVLAKNVALLELGEKYATHLKRLAQGEGEKKLFGKIGQIPKSESSGTSAAEIRKDETPQVDVGQVLDAYRNALSKV
jgi:hypothetical protein